MSKKSFITILVFAALSMSAHAQDIIVTRDAKKINAKVTEINAENVKYKLFEHQDGPTYTLTRADIVSIIYQNGVVEAKGYYDYFISSNNAHANKDRRNKVSGNNTDSHGKSKFLRP